MKILLYFENEEMIRRSGIGRALDHQKKALESASISYTEDPGDTDYDILHINTYGTASDRIIHKARKLGKPIVYHAHSTKEDFQHSFACSELIAPFFNHRIVRLYSKADAIITPTPYSKQLLESYGISVKIHAVSNGVDVQAYIPDEEKIQAFRNYFHLSEQDRTVISAGLPFARKGLIDFLEIAKTLPQYTFIWFGDLSHILLPQEINRAMHNKPDNVLFPGYITGDVFKGAFAGGDCFFFPSYEETEGIVILEALASRQTIIARDIGAYRAWAVDGENCYLGSSNKEFAWQIDSVIHKRLAPTGDAGLKVAQERDIAIIGKQLESIYTSVLNRK